VGSCSEDIWVDLMKRSGAITLSGCSYKPPNSTCEVQEPISQQIMGRCNNNRVDGMGDGIP